MPIFFKSIKWIVYMGISNINEKNILTKIFTDDPIELFTVLEGLKRTDISVQGYITIIFRCKQVIFRNIRPNEVNKTGKIFYPGDDINVSNPVKSNINIFTRILSHVIHRKQPNTVILEALCDNDVYKLFNNLKSNDVSERKHITDIIINVYQHYNVFYKIILRVCTNEIISYNENMRTHVGIENLIDILKRILNDKRVGHDTKQDLYYQTLLQFMKTKHFEFYKTSHELIFRYSSTSVEKAKDFIGYTMSIFWQLEYSNRASVVSLLNRILAIKIDEIEFDYISDGYANILNDSFESGNFLLIEECLSLFENTNICRVFKKNILEFLPKIFNSLYTLSKKYWRKKGKIKLYKNISILLAMNHNIFEECIIKYNKSRHLQRETETIVTVLEKCIEHKSIEEQHEERLNKRRKSSNDIF